MATNQPPVDGSGVLTVEAFVECRWDEPDGGRWTELVDGRLVTYEPPDPVHGNAALAISKQVAAFVDRNPDCGCPAFDLGLVIRREPDTVRFPLLAWFPDEARFARSDDIVSDTPPALVVDVVSNPDRRREVTDRVLGYLEWGVETVWLFDAGDRTIHTQRKGASPSRFGPGETFVGHSKPFTLQTPVDAIFADPEWWNGPPRSRTPG